MKQSDGPGLLRRIRQDGSVTWQKQTKHSAHFALHDLTHYTVETCLGYSQGFFGLIAIGWDIDDTTGKGSRGPLPPEALEVEPIVGLFDAERASYTLWTCEEFNRHAPRTLTQQDLHCIRSLRARLFRLWSDTSSSEALNLMFEITQPTPK